MGYQMKVRCVALPRNVAERMGLCDESLEDLQAISDDHARTPETQEGE